MEHTDQPPPLSEAQLEIMNLVWSHGPMTVGEMWQILSSRRGVARNTVQTLVTRLEEKGWLAHSGEGGVFRCAHAASLSCSRVRWRRSG